MKDEELKFAVALTLIEGVGPVNAKKLLAYFGSIEKIFNQKKSKLIKVPGIGEYIANSIKKFNQFERAEKEVEFIRKFNITPLFYTDEEYPYRLKAYDDAPVILFCKGNMNLNADKIISIVGTRNPTDYGKSFCNKLIEKISGHDILVISGMAFGIDITAHRACLKHNLSTVGVMAHGLDRIYPPEHKSTAEKMLTNGGLITEFVSKTIPDKENFPKRNRIVAGLADATIVIETAVKGGSMITAQLAFEYNKDVFALPGRINDEKSKGCNLLIKQNKAAMIESAEDLLRAMNWDKNVKSKKSSLQTALFVSLTAEEEQIVNYIKERGNTPIDVISVNCNMPVSLVSAHLLNLEFKGLIKSLPGKIYGLS